MTSNKLMIATAFAIYAMNFDAANGVLVGGVSAARWEREDRIRSEYVRTHSCLRTLRLPDGKLYNGDVKRDSLNTPNGIGALRYPDGSTLKAWFLNGIPQKGYEYMFELFSEDSKDVGKLKYAADDAHGRRKFRGDYGADCLPSNGTLTYRDNYHRKQFEGSLRGGQPYNGFLTNRRLDGRGKLKLEIADGNVLLTLK